LILQLGYILHSVPAWEKAFQLRILVFVEYESEVEEERARLNALLEKLRMQAEVRVFWLASGRLSTYENIVNGKSSDSESDRWVNELLKDDEWWQELQRLRNESWQTSRSQELVSFGDLLDTTRRRSSGPLGTEDDATIRRLSMHDIQELPKKPTVSKISKLGVNFGIHTHQLNPNLLDGQTRSKKFYEMDEDDGESSSSSDADFNEAASEGSERELDDEASRRASWFPGRRTSHGDLLRHREIQGKPRLKQHQPSAKTSETGASDYGTIKYSSTALKKSSGRPENSPSVLSPLLESTVGGHSGSTSGPKVPTTPLLSRHPSRNQTGSSTPRTDRPAISRNSSYSRFSSRPVPDTRIEDEGGHGERLTFAESEHLPIRSRRNSGVSEVRLNIPELLESYRIGNMADAEARSNYSTASLPLSFNDLPSRAQHLILNDIMRQHSNDTAVLLTTLPIPEEGTCKTDEASLRYLSDIEVLCHDLPPVLLVLSNNMTVTVNL
jgi:solute carrier family 12 (potassium/chloride transporters), member 9